MIARLKGFAGFWYHFFVGDDWTVAVGVVIAMAATALAARMTTQAWWITPAAALVLLAVSVYRGASGAATKSGGDADRRTDAD
jgi:CHASE2 domain-containing sensor protein